MKRFLLVLALYAAAGCAKKPEAPAKPPLTERQRETAIGDSRLPGAAVVRGALKAQDKLRADANHVDSAGN